MHKTRALLFATATCLLAPGCALYPKGPVCTEIYVYGVNVTVTDENGDPVSGATLTLVEGEFSEVMEEIRPGEGEYVGAGERAGTYTLIVEADGYDTATIENIAVNADECHVIPVSREVILMQQVAPMP